jgi:hypothetical protein
MLRRRTELIVSVLTFIFSACTRHPVDFGSVPENNYTHLAQIDTVGIRLSSVLTDSFVTSNATSFLAGNYKDPYLGTVKARCFFQLDKPETLPEIPSNAVYDSITLRLKLNDYYYGDTSKAQTISVYELDQAIVSSYGGKLFNTSNVLKKPTPIGQKRISIRPTADDSVVIRLDDNKGSELFLRLRQQSQDLSTRENFQNYFKGLSVGIHADDTTAVFGFTATSGAVGIRVHYHTTTPFIEKFVTEFPSISNEFSFNQIITNRAGTGIVPGTTGMTEIPIQQTNGYAFSQPGTGLALKMSFPSLKNVLLTHEYIKILKAELIVRPATQSFDQHKYRLPPRLQLAYTDASNLNGGFLYDSTGNGIMEAKPSFGDFYGENAHYRFNITAYISQMLASPDHGYGVYVLPQFSNVDPVVDRLVVSNIAHGNYISQLQLSVLIVNK